MSFNYILSRQVIHLKLEPLPPPNPTQCCQRYSSRSRSLGSIPFIDCCAPEFTAPCPLFIAFSGSNRGRGCLFQWNAVGSPPPIPLLIAKISFMMEVWEIGCRITKITRGRTNETFNNTLTREDDKSLLETEGGRSQCHLTAYTVYRSDERDKELSEQSFFNHYLQWFIKVILGTLNFCSLKCFPTESYAETESRAFDVLHCFFSRFSCCQTWTSYGCLLVCLNAWWLHY